MSIRIHRYFVSSLLGRGISPSWKRWQTILEINKKFMQPTRSLNMYSRGPNCFFLGVGGGFNCFKTCSHLVPKGFPSSPQMIPQVPNLFSKIFQIKAHFLFQTLFAKVEFWYINNQSGPKGKQLYGSILGGSDNVLKKHWWCANQSGSFTHTHTHKFLYKENHIWVLIWVLCRTN